MGSNPTVLPKFIMRLNRNETNSSAYKKQRRIEIAAETGGCDRCKPHGGENYRLKGKKPKPDVHKNKNRATVRREA